MKILLYSDLHISKTSSILPLVVPDSNYSYRQNMILKIGDFLSNLVAEQMPDLIINLGDTFDQHIISSYDIKVASEFFKKFEKFSNIPHIVLVGNHEMVNTNFNAVELLDNIPNIQVINTPCTLYNELAFLPYCNYKDIISFPDGRFLFSHQDIQGSSIRGDFALQEGIDRRVLLDRYRLVFNGHIHKPSIKDNIINVGSVVTHSFSDDETTVPQCYIFNTDTLDLKVFKPKGICPLFRRIDIDDIDEFKRTLNELYESGYEYVLQCCCNYEDRELIKDVIQHTKFVVSNRFNFKMRSKDNGEIESDTTLITNVGDVDLTDAFKSFIEKNAEDLKYPTAMYLNVLKGDNLNVLEKEI